MQSAGVMLTWGYNMAHRIQIARAWCDECLSQCFFAHDENTGVNQHLGNSTSDLATKSQELKAKGYYESHRSGVYTYTLYKAAPLALPLEWQMAIEERQLVDVDQDW